MAALEVQHAWVTSDTTERRLRLARLTLTNFRNYQACAVDLDGRSVVLTGRNGSGKTKFSKRYPCFRPDVACARAPFGELAAPGGRWRLGRVRRGSSLDGDEISLGTGQQRRARRRAPPAGWCGSTASRPAAPARSAIICRCSG